MAEQTSTAPEISRDALVAAWRDRVGEPRLPELASLTCLLWLVRDFFDSTTSRGEGDRLIAQAFGADEVL